MHDYTISISALSPSVVLFSFFVLGFIIGFFVRDLELLIDEVMFSIRHKNREKTTK